MQPLPGGGAPPAFASTSATERIPAPCRSVKPTRKTEARTSNFWGGLVFQPRPQQFSFCFSLNKSGLCQKNKKVLKHKFRLHWILKFIWPVSADQRKSHPLQRAPHTVLAVLGMSPLGGENDSTPTPTPGNGISGQKIYRFAMGLTTASLRQLESISFYLGNKQTAV